MENTGREEGINFTDGVPIPPHRGLHADEAVVVKTQAQEFVGLLNKGVGIEVAEVMVFGNPEPPIEGEVVDEKQ